MTNRDHLSCGCFWHRDPNWGDVLEQCVEHKNGAKYEGSDPMSEPELEDFITSLVMVDVDVVSPKLPNKA